METAKRDITFSMNIKSLPSKVGVLLLNIGTPATTAVDDVRDYLARFLGDDRVIDIQPSWLKFGVLQLLLNTRPQKSAENYKRIWDSKRGSPLQFHTEDLAAGLQMHLGDEFIVRIGFQYSEPFTGDALESLVNERVSQVIVVPMFPHYASGTCGTTLAAVYERAAQMYCVPPIVAVQPFFDESSFLEAQASLIRDAVGSRGEEVDHILFSFHGLPVTQCTSAHQDGSTCDRSCACRYDEGNRNCYRAQCHETARLLAKRLDLDTDRCSVAFQSRLTLRGTVEWITPYTDDAFESLAKQGIKRLAIVAPSFTADCIETLEELGITGRKQFLEAGGEELVVVPCVNASTPWIAGLAQLVRDQVPRAVSISF
jgi:ferrochelatase